MVRDYVSTDMYMLSLKCEIRYFINFRKETVKVGTIQNMN
jgi:hypothetical protein